jgi:hypothetical protein
MSVNNLDPKHWLERAASARAKADRSRSDQHKQKLLQVAEEYERMARRAEQAIT